MGKGSDENRRVLSYKKRKNIKTRKIYRAKYGPKVRKINADAHMCIHVYTYKYIAHYGLIMRNFAIKNFKVAL